MGPGVDDQQSFNHKMSVNISISDCFDGGNIKFIRQVPNENDINIIDIILHIKPDVYTVLEKIGHMQYFSFRSTIGGLEGSQKVNYVLENAGMSILLQFKYCMPVLCFINFSTLRSSSTSLFLFEFNRGSFVSRGMARNYCVLFK